LGDALAISAMQYKKFGKFDFKKIHPAGNLGMQLKTVEDIMITGNKIPFVKESLKMKSAIKILSNKKLGVLIVQNKQKKTIGVITDGQIRRFNQTKNNVSSLRVIDVMTKNPISIDKNALAAKALALMNSKKITSLCVYDNKNKFKTIGILHIHNILESNIS
jgi:arabinose-5-phosphate isomerase